MALSETAGLLDRLVPPADRPAGRWHVSPAVDLSAYHFSWVWILVPLALSGDRYPADYIGLFAFGMTLSLVHRYWTLPYVYLDKQIFSQHVTRFTLFFYLLNLGSVASAFLYGWKAPRDFFRPVDVALALAGAALVVQCVVAEKRGRAFSPPAIVAAAAPFTLATVLGLAGVFTKHHELVAVVVALSCAAASAYVARSTKTWMFAVVSVAAAVAGAGAVLGADAPLHAARAVSGKGLVGVAGLVAGVWNIWHTLMQKFGIMRMYAAKSSVPLDKRTPAWVDRFLIFGSFPLLALVVGPAQKHFIEGQAKAVTQYLRPVIAGLELVQPWLLAPAALVAIASIACFVAYEKRADGLTGWPRLSMAAALTLLSASFLVLSPLKVYIAYGFSHAVEYMVFVWAFLRRRYAHPLAHKPLLERVLQRPLLAYGGYTALIGLTYFVVDYGKQFHLYTHGIAPFGVNVGTWMFSFAIWQSIAHFYFDGFLWKMRAPAVRASL